MVDALTFLPPDDVQEGMQLLRRIAPILAEDLLNYFDSIYAIGTLRIVKRNGNNIVRHPHLCFPKSCGMYVKQLLMMSLVLTTNAKAGIRYFCIW